MPMHDHACVRFNIAQFLNLSNEKTLFNATVVLTSQQVGQHEPCFERRRPEPMPGICATNTAYNTVTAIEFID